MDVEFCQKLFLHLLRWSYGFILQFVNVVYHTDLEILKNPCILGINPTWLSWMILLMYCWIQFANNLLRTFSSVFISDTGLVLVSGWSWSCRMSLEVFLPLQCTNHFYTFMKYVFVLPLMVKDYLCLSFFFHLCAWTRGLIEVTACISIFR